eukprot:scaffold8989_cov87-Phaeocystis_antarctica.AAC.5
MPQGCPEFRPASANQLLRRLWSCFRHGDDRLGTFGAQVHVEHDATTFDERDGWDGWAMARLCRRIQTRRLRPVGEHVNHAVHFPVRVAAAIVEALHPHMMPQPVVDVTQRGLDQSLLAEAACSVQQVITTLHVEGLRLRHLRPNRLRRNHLRLHGLHFNRLHLGHLRLRLGLRARVTTKHLKRWRLQLLLEAADLPH